jgi:hypothetical protein
MMGAVSIEKAPDTHVSGALLLG